MSQKEKESHLWKRKPTGLHSLPTPHHFLSTFLKMWSNLDQRSPSFLFPNLIPLLAERNQRKIQKRSWRRKERKRKNSGENQNRVGFSKRSYPGSKTCSFPPLFFFFLFLAHPRNCYFEISGSDERASLITISQLGTGERSKKGGFKGTLAVSQREAPSWAPGCCRAQIASVAGLWAVPARWELD